jgi:hypothetical protein
MVARKSIDFDKDYMLLVNYVQEANKYAMYLLTEVEHDGSALQAMIAIKPTNPHLRGAITE